MSTNAYNIKQVLHALAVVDALGKALIQAGPVSFNVLRVAVGDRQAASPESLSRRVRRPCRQIVDGQAYLEGQREKESVRVANPATGILTIRSRRYLNVEIAPRLLTSFMCGQ